MPEDPLHLFLIVSVLRFAQTHYTDSHSKLRIQIQPTPFAMAENAPPTSSSTLPPPPQPSTGAPGQPQFDSAQGNGQGTGAHMPPPSLPPVVIPQKTNPIPTAITSPMSGQMMSPTSTGGFVRRAAPEPNKRALYIGGLDARVTEDILKQIFETTGHVQSVKIIPDKNVSI